MPNSLCCFSFYASKELFRNMLKEYQAVTLSGDFRLIQVFLNPTIKLFAAIQVAK